MKENFWLLAVASVLLVGVLMWGATPSRGTARPTMMSSNEMMDRTSHSRSGMMGPRGEMMQGMGQMHSPEHKMSEHMAQCQQMMQQHMQASSEKKQHAHRR